MRLRMSLFNKQMILQVGRSVGWISVIYFIGLLFALPIRIMMTYSNVYYRDFPPVVSLFHFDFGLQIILFLSVPVLLAVFLYRFLHVKQAADLMHSMPVKREKIYHFYTLTGLVFLILPVLLIALITILIHSIYDLNLHFQLTDIAVWTGTVILFNSVFYMAGVFIAMVTGISAVHGVLTYILLLFPAGFTLLVIYNLGMLLYGFPTNYYQVRNIEKLTPITHMTWLERENLSTSAILIYAAILTSLYILSLIIYKKRKIEAASEAIAFARLKIVFKYGVTFCSMLLGGLYFDAGQNEFAWLLFGYAFGAIIGYFVAEMVLQKSWRVFKRIRGLGFFAVTTALFIIAIQAYTPYEQRVPATREIKTVLMTEMMFSPEDGQHVPKPLMEPDNIKAIRDLHAKIIDNEKVNEQGMNMQENALFIYELENGRKMVRQYLIDPRDYKKELADIRGSLEYKHATNPLFSVKSGEADLMRITDGSVVNKSLTITESADIDEAITLLKKEIEEEKYVTADVARGNRSQIEIRLDNDEYIFAELKFSYNEFISWLKEKDMLDQAMVSAEDIDYIMVTDEVIKEEDFKQYPENEITERIMTNKKAVKITEKMEIQSALENADYSWYGEGRYIAVFVYKTGSQKEIRSFSEKHVPDFIAQHFK